MPKWFHITISVLLAFLAIGSSILICGKHHWGYIPCAAIAIVLFACFYEFLRFCFWAGAKLTIAYADAFQKCRIGHFRFHGRRTVPSERVCCFIGRSWCCCTHPSHQDWEEWQEGTTHSAWLGKPQLEYCQPVQPPAQFAQYTFPAWFWNITTETLAKKLKHRSGDLYIKIDESIDPKTNNLF